MQHCNNLSQSSNGIMSRLNQVRPGSCAARMATGAHQCVACGAVPTRACSTQCPKCAGRVYVCAKACQRRWWAQHKALCQVLPAPTAEPAPDEKAAALVRLDPDVAEHIWCGLGPADVARVSGAARALLGDTQD